jgi:hypothetical protein
MEADGRPQKKPTSPWVYVGCGCGALVLLAMMGLAGLTWWGYRTGKEFSETLTDPEKRAAKVKSVLPYDSLPEGYYPAFAISMPMGFMEMAMFSDRDPGTGPSAEKNQGFDERGFLYMNMVNARDNKAKMERYVRGETPRPEDSGWAQTDVRFNAKENIRRGTLTVNGTQVLYSANRGEVSREGRADRDGIVTMVMPQCPDNRMRFAMWFGPDPAPEKPVAEADFAGTTADPAAIEEFLGHFRLCGK